MTANVYGLTASNTALIRAAINRVIAGTGDARVIVIGDSTDAGTGSNALGGNGLRSQSWVSQLAPKLVTRFGITVPFEGIFGGIGKTTANYALYNPQVTINSGTFAASNVGPGGPLWNHAVASGATVLTPTNAFDRVRFFWKGNTVGRDIVLNASAGGLSQGSLVGDGTFAYKMTVVSCTSSTSISWRASTAATVELIGLETYNNAGSKLFLNNMGWGGSTSGTASDGWTQATGGGTRPLVSIPLIAPDLGIINLNINDMFAGTTTAQWKINVQQLIDAVKQSGDCILCTSNPLNVSKYGSEAAQAPFFTAIAELAATNAIPFVDVKTYLGTTWVAADASGYMSDNEHMLAAGYLQKAVLMDQVFADIMSATSSSSAGGAGGNSGRKGYVIRKNGRRTPIRDERDLLKVYADINKRRKMSRKRSDDDPTAGT